MGRLSHTPCESQTDVDIESSRSLLHGSLCNAQDLGLMDILHLDMGGRYSVRFQMQRRCSL